jgi:hypothetical protein
VRVPDSGVSSTLLTNDIFATHNNNTFFFKKDYRRNSFDLYRYSLPMAPCHNHKDWDKLESEWSNKEVKLGDYVI